MGPKYYDTLKCLDFEISIASCTYNSIYLTEEEMGRKETSFLSLTAKI